MPARPKSPRDTELIVLANREPYRHYRDDAGQLHARRSASGVVNAVEPLLLAHSGVWVGEGVGAADRDAARDRDGVDVPIGNPRYRLRRVWLSPDEQQGYYYGFANSALWPLCHRTAVEPLFYAKDFHSYELVNRIFADAVAEEAADASPIVLVQDYHFALAPMLIRRQLPRSRIAMFWHIPWPRPETFGICPWSRALVEGMLGSTSLGFQTAADRLHFLAAVEQLLGGEVDRERSVVHYKSRSVTVGVYPASIDWPSTPDRQASIAACRSAVAAELGVSPEIRLGVGVDRFDYTKGIEHKCLAIERLLERQPDLVGRFVFAQLAEPTREGLPAYRTASARVREVVQRVNGRFGAPGVAPIRLLEAHHSSDRVMSFLRAADFCHVGSLHDGMNLVSKEFVRARDDERGVLVLSTFTGAARELSDALIVNPYDIDEVSTAMSSALSMSMPEARDRMRRLRQVVAGATARDWAARILADVASEPAPDVVDRWSLSDLPSLVSPPRLAASDVSAS